MSTRPAARPGPDEGPQRGVRAVPRPHAVVGVGVVVVGPDGRILLGQAHDGRWELPGGKVDPGEGFEQAAARELAEETGLRTGPEGIRILSVQINPASDVTRLTAAAVTTTAEGTPAVTEPHKIARWAWFAAAELPEALFPPSVAVLRAWRPELTATLPPTPSYDYPTTTT
ncbi:MULTISPECIES: NUDIX domain-containing protein [unclassified Streptomyces]|uniref:nucleotide triphosphate diphosphatase NUDT15 n=1 Tax=unclassified Streptomyces TaxID=2593676 RepID=UPI000DC79019|nr:MULTISPECIES: NUDIX domain-containing protein [unclassified Streptomyces]AWZ09866.1 DNA mismatch repair protein MutT [Streptomyces sp. ICC4]AWZ17534.1 DNA mismatch repair protein MutT [Streptomyces sp. ICC1]